MEKANTLKALAAATLFAGTVPAQTSELLYQDLRTKDSVEISAPEATPLDETITFFSGQEKAQEDSVQVRSHINKTSSAPTWTVINSMNYGLPYNGFNSLYFDPSDSTRLLGAVGGMTVKDTTVHAYGYSGETSCFPILSNGFASYKDGDTLYRGTQSNGGTGGLVKQSPAGCSVNTTLAVGNNAKIRSVIKYQGYIYVATSSNGLYVLDGNGSISQNYTTTNSILPTNLITKLSTDNQGNLRVALGIGGIIKINGSVWTLYNTANTGIDFSSGLTDIIPDNNGNVRFGNDGLYKYNIGSGWSAVSVPVSTSLVVLGLTVDQFNNLWVATKYDGVLKLDGGTGQWTAYDTTTDPTIFTSNRVNAIAADTTNPTEMHIGIGSDASGFIQLKHSTADYLPAIPAGAHIDGQDTVVPGQTYTYTLSTPITNAQNYIWSYTGIGATTITPKSGGTEVDITFGPGATPGNIVCKFQNNYTKPVTDTVQLTFAINDITTGIEENTTPEKVVVAPNPTTDMISVLNMKNKNIKSVEVYTTDWKQVRKQSIGRGEEVKVDVADLPAGSYVMLLKDIRGNGYTAKFIKQ